MSSCAVIDCIGIESNIHENFDALDKHIFLSREVNQRLLNWLEAFCGSKVDQLANVRRLNMYRLTIKKMVAMP